MSLLLGVWTGRISGSVIWSDWAIIFIWGVSLRFYLSIKNHIGCSRACRRCDEIYRMEMYYTAIEFSVRV
jgi:hypothetical protein